MDKALEVENSKFIFKFNLSCLELQYRREVKLWIDPVQDYSVTAREERSVTKTERGDCGNKAIGKGKGKVHTRTGHEGRGEGG